MSRSDARESLVIPAPWLRRSLAVLMTAGLTAALPAQSREWEQSSPYYEDDAWYDISEWFDGNDYNPTDERFGVIDDEKYDGVYESSDADSDYTYGNFDYDYGNRNDSNSVVSRGYDRYDDDWRWFGYDEDSSDDWFYDWYDDGYASWNDWDNDGLFNSRYRYFDYDDDGFYDAVLTQYDLDGDGRYDQSDFLTFSDKVQQNQSAQSRQNQDRLSRAVTVTGKVQRTKTASLNNSRNLIAELSSQDGETVHVDLGPAERLQGDLQRGDRITVKGASTRIGDKRIVVAKSVDLNGRQVGINRNTRQTKGQVVSTHQARRQSGGSHLIAMIEQGGRRLAVDLGDSESARRFRLQEGDQITAFGPRVKIGDQPLLMAQSIRKNDRTYRIERDRARQQQQQQSGMSESRTTTRFAESRDRDAQANASQRNQRDQRPARVSGSISEMQQVNVRGSRRQIARIKTDRGHQVVLDLGPAGEFNADLQRGDDVRADGLLTHSGDQQVLLVTCGKANGERFEISSRLPSRQTHQRKAISGEIVRLERRDVRGVSRQFATIESDQGEQLAIDLGPRDQLQTDLREGDQIRARGPIVRTGDRQTLIAEQVTHEGRSIQVLRPDLEGQSEKSDRDSDRTQESDRYRDRTQ